MICKGILTVVLLAATLFAQEIVILGNNNKFPKKYLCDGKPSGILVDIMEHIDSQLPENFTYKFYPWKRAFLMASEAGGGIIGLSKTEERLKEFDYSEPIYYDEVVMVVRKDDVFTYSSPKDLQGKVVGAIRGASFGDEFEEGKANHFTLQGDTDDERRLTKLLLKRIDIALIGCGKTSAEKVIRESECLSSYKDSLVVLEAPFAMDANHLGFHKSLKMKPFLEEFNKVLQKAWEDGTIDAIIARYENRLPCDSFSK